MDMTTYVFPGQGSQAKGMGKDLFAEFPDMVKIADQVLGYSIEQLCLEDPAANLNNTDYTQPALYVVNALSYQKKLKESGTKPNYVAGHSLGEYNALLAAEVFDFETGLKLVQKRGALMRQATGGGMAAVIGLTGEAVQKILSDNGKSNINIANYNSNKQVVISGPKEEIDNAESLFKDAGAMLYMPLKVSGAFHSPYMSPAQQEFVEFIKNYSFLPPSIPVIANVDAQPYQASNVTTKLGDQINHPVQWTQSIKYLLNQGESSFEEVGPGKVLTGLITRIQKGD